MIVTEAILRRLCEECIIPTTRSSTESYDAFTNINEPLWQAFFRSLTADRSALSPRISADYKRTFYPRLHDLSLSTGLTDEQWIEVSKVIAEVVEDKDMFVTVSDYIGSGQEGIATGDHVVI